MLRMYVGDSITGSSFLVPQDVKNRATTSTKPSNTKRNLVFTFVVLSIGTKNKRQNISLKSKESFKKEQIV